MQCESTQSDCDPTQSDSTQYNVMQKNIMLCISIWSLLPLYDNPPCEIKKDLPWERTFILKLLWCYHHRVSCSCTIYSCMTRLDTPPTRDTWSKETWWEVPTDSSGDERARLRNSLETRNQSKYKINGQKWLVTFINNKGTGPLLIIAY